MSADHRLLTLTRWGSRILLGLSWRLRARQHGRTGLERVDAILVVNLAARADRLRRFAEEMEGLQIDAWERFDAVQDSSGILGCTRSHAACLRRMVERGWECVMICEDDAQFHVSRAELDVLVDAFLTDPRGEVAMLAYNHLRPPRRHNLFYVRAPIDTRNAACYLVKRSIADDLLSAFEEGARCLSAGGDRDVFGVDVAWRELQATRVFLLPIVRVASQVDGFSDIEGRIVSYGGV